ncbi:hypothetical protein GCM10007897_42490 [Sphingobium jiangsuense]|nr:putative HNHc nuclease [Sphingobium jiangsuense]GLT02825.1 hypothetical protein GCM10007897_42490 [Sphingobium jiangsuense]
MLPRRIPKPPKRSGRWRSQAHCSFVRSHACCACGSTVAIEVAHVRTGTGAGMGQKPHDYWTISLCRDCHARQHQVGETTFERNNRINMKELAEEFCRQSPKRHEIMEAKRNV